ncbi:MAG TPA: polysaccharide biosynthesis/export family protein [Acidobacteriaceae bacterium]|nr:polysaccharide biosynthesis/export family protein [Acidobacteriaceae bacterium]
MTALAQYSGQGSSSTAVDCANPMNASSPACTGSGNLDTSGAAGQNGMAMPTYGSSTGFGAGQQMPTSNGLPIPGLNQSNPSYVDQNPYHRLQNGYPYNPYSLYVQPKPPTEFQRIVAGSVGRMLPIYGADLFSNVPTTFAPVDRIPVTPDYVIGPGDEVLIRVWGQVSFNVHATVDRTGDIYLPQVGDVHIAGLQFSQLDSYLRSQLGRVFRNFDVNANMGQLRSIQIFVVGQAQRPGSYTVSSLSTLVNALFASGGPSIHGSMRQIQVKRGDKIVTTFDLYDLLLRGDKSKDTPLLSGDVIYIPPVGPLVAIAGSVQVPAIYELKGNETAEDAIQLAGGLSTMAARQTAQLDRTGSQGRRETVDLSLDATGLQTPLRDGDILRILSLVPRFDKTVTLRGNVANPGRYAWHAGMRIRDLIPDKESLVTRNYWERRIALGLPAPEYMPLYTAYPRSTYSQQMAGRTSQARQNPGTSAMGNFATGSSDQREQYPQAQGINSSPAIQMYDQQGNPIDQGNTVGAVGNAVGNARDGQPGSASGPEQQSNEAGSSSVSAAQVGTASPAAQSRIYPPGDRFSEDQFPVRNEVIRSAPDIDWQYAVIERTNKENLTTSLVPFNLGQAILNDDTSQNLELQPGDVVTVFSTADIRVPQMQRTKYVRLEGEFVHAGVYSLLPGETLQQLVIRVGGLTPQAYLYGSELLRESTRRVQQARLDEYVNQMQHDIQESASNAVNTAVNAQAAATLSTSVQSQRELIATLRLLRASGRIVLNLNPYSTGVGALPDLPLEDGDRFVVPPVPSTVNVVGAVYDQNSFLYGRAQRVDDYLRKAGGATRNGDKRHEFVVRADGSVLSKQYAGGTFFGGGFGSKYMYPGDTVVVPDNVSKTTLLRGLTDWSQVLSGFGLGIASLTLLGL